MYSISSHGINTGLWALKPLIICIAISTLLPYVSHRLPQIIKFAKILWVDMLLHWPHIHLSTVGSYHGFLKATARRSRDRGFPFNSAVKNIEFLVEQVLQGSVIMPLR